MRIMHRISSSLVVLIVLGICMISLQASGGDGGERVGSDSDTTLTTKSDNPSPKTVYWQVLLTRGVCTGDRHGLYFRLYLRKYYIS